VDTHFDAVFPEFLWRFVMPGSWHGLTVLWKEVPL
jgi:hypothetical protein